MSRLERLTRKRLGVALPELLAIDAGTLGEPWFERHFLCDLPGKWDLSWLCSDAGSCVGFVVASDKGLSVHVHRIAVLRAAWGRGVGTRLLARVAVGAVERGRERVTLRLAAENDRAMRFYGDLGFDRLGAVEGVVDLAIDADALERSCAGRAEVRRG